MRKTILAAVSAGALVLGAAACGTDDGDTAGDTAGDTVATATDAVGDGAAEATDTAGDAGAEATDTADDGETDAEATGTDEAGAENGDAGDGATAPIAGPDGEVQVPQGIADKYEELGGEGGHLGALQGEPMQEGDGTMVNFAGGALFQKGDGPAHLVQGRILEHYTELGGPGGDLGFPTADEQPIDGGWISEFENGSISFVNDEFQVEQ